MKTFWYKIALPLLNLALLCCFSGSISHLNAQTACNTIAFSVVKMEPCRYRVFVNNTDLDCYNEATLLLQAGYYTSFSANAADGWLVEQSSSTELLLTNASGLFPIDSTMAVDFEFFEPGGTDPTLSILYPNICIMDGCFVDIPLEGCEGGCVSGTVYRECAGLPYTDQIGLEDWTVQVLDQNSVVVSNAVTETDGTYSICDLPPGQYFVKAVNPGSWNANLPPGGQWSVNVSAAGNYTRDFGFCPPCSCDSLNMLIAQEPSVSDTTIYYFQVEASAYCFMDYILTIENGELVDYVLLDTNTVLENIGPNMLTLGVCCRKVPYVKLRIAGPGSHNITVRTAYDIGAGLVSCIQEFQYPPSLPASCCPSGSVPGSELVANGDFEAGNTGFTSGHSYKAAGALSAGQYTVVQSNQVPGLNNQWACTDHTNGSPTGKMLVIDGSLNPPAIRNIWAQNAPVVAGETYTFSAWVNNLVIPSENYNDPQVELYIDGKAVAGIVLPEVPDKWWLMCVQWTAPATGTAALEVRIGRFDNEGNDFAVDDISFRSCEAAPCQADFTVNYINQCGHVQLTNTSAGVPPFSTLWSDSSTGNTLDLQLPCGSYTYCLTVTDAANCTSTICKTVTVSDAVPPIAVCVPGFGVDLDASCQYALSAGMIDGGSTDNCQIQSISISHPLLTGCGNYQVTLTVEDWCGNTSTCTTGVQTIEVVPPVIQCPASITVQGDPALGGVYVPLPPPDVLTDNCAIDGYATDPANGLFPCGVESTVIYTATDGCGNTATCSMTVFVEDCLPAANDSCCAFALHLINNYTNDTIKYVRVTGLCDTKICCADPDEWAQSNQYPYNISWRPADGSPVLSSGVQDESIDNDFLIWLSEPGLNSIQVEWIDKNEIVICRHVIEISCNGMFDDENEDWTQYTSVTGLDDPNLFVIITREEDEDSESQCDPEELDVKECDFTSDVVCLGGGAYGVTLQGPSGYDQYNWQVGSGPSYPGIQSGAAPYFTVNGPGSYVIAFEAKNSSTGAVCAGMRDVTISTIEADFSWKYLPCTNGLGVEFTASGWENAGFVDVIYWTCTGQPSFPSPGNPATYTFPAPGTYEVTVTIVDIFGCGHKKTYQVEVSQGCRPDFKVDSYAFCPADCFGTNQAQVNVTFQNTSSGGCVTDYTWIGGNAAVTSNQADEFVTVPFTVNCPNGSTPNVTLIMDDQQLCLGASVTIPINIVPCNVNFSYVACPDGRVNLEGNVKGTWDLTGNIEIAPWPYSDIKDIHGRRKKVVARYPPGVHLVKFTGHCGSGGACEVIKEIIVPDGCCTKNEKVKGKQYFSDGNKSFKMKAKLVQNQYPLFVHNTRVVARLKFKKGVKKFTIWRRAKGYKLEADINGKIFFRDQTTKCNCIIPETLSLYDVNYKSRVSITDHRYFKRFRSMKGSLMSTPSATVGSNTYTLPLSLGNQCDKFQWWFDWF